MRTGKDSPGTGAKDYQDLGTPAPGGDFSNSSRSGGQGSEMKTVSKVADGGANPNYQNSRNVSGDMQPDFYDGTASSMSGSDRNTGKQTPPC